MIVIALDLKTEEQKKTLNSALFAVINIELLEESKGNEVTALYKNILNKFDFDKVMCFV